MSNRFYVYAHIDDSGNIFYIGKGKGKRYKSFSQDSRSQIWWNHVGKYCKSLPRAVILCDGLTEKQAFDKEVELIAKYGRKDLGTGTLVNLTDGGEGFSGIVITEEAKHKMSESATIKFKDPEVRSIYSHSQRNRFQDQQERNKISASCKDNPKVLAAQAKGAEAVKGKPAWNRGKQASQDTLAKLSQAKHNWYASLTPEQREAHNTQLAKARANNQANKPKVVTPEEVEARKQAKREYLKQWKRDNRAKQGHKPRKKRVGSLPGCSYHRQSGKWIAKARVDGKPKYLGIFPTEEEAHLAYLSHIPTLPTL